MCHQSCKTGEIGTYWSGFGTNDHAAILLRARLVVFVILILCNAAAAAVVPRLYAPAPRGAVVSPTHNLLTRWLSLHISLSPLGSPARQRSYISSVCTPCHCLCYRHEKSSCYFFFPPPTCVWHYVYSHLSARAMAAGVSILSDLPNSIGGARSGETSTEMEAGRRALHHTNNTGTTPAFYLARRWHRTGWVFFNVGLGSTKIILILFSALIRKTDEWKCVWCTVCNRRVKWVCCLAIPKLAEWLESHSKNKYGGRKPNVGVHNQRLVPSF